MAHPLFHVPMRFVKRTIIDRARVINTEGSDDNLTGPLGLRVADSSDHILAEIHGRITIVRTAMSPEVFGAEIHVVGHYFRVPAGEAMINYDLILPQVDDNTFIGPASIRVRGFNQIQVNDVNAFIQQVETQILDEWQ